MALSKKAKAIQDKIDISKDYGIEEAIELLKSAPKAKFNESVDLSVNLGIDATKSDQGVRGSSTLPHGIGKNMTVVAFADGEDEKAAKDAGADEVGFEDLIDKVKKEKNLVADIVVATPECMKKMGQLGRILGPKNLMPNPKEGTVTKNIAEAVTKAKKGEIRHKNQKYSNDGMNYTCLVILISDLTFFCFCYCLGNILRNSALLRVRHQIFRT